MMVALEIALPSILFRKVTIMARLDQSIIQVNQTPLEMVANTKLPLGVEIRTKKKKKIKADLQQGKFSDTGDPMTGSKKKGKRAK